MLPALLYGCETWTLTRDLRWRLDSFGTRTLHQILGDRWSDFVSNERLLRETRIRFDTCIVCERQLWLYGHVAHFPDSDPAHQTPSLRESGEQDQRQENEPHVHTAAADAHGLCR